MLQSFIARTCTSSRAVRSVAVLFILAFVLANYLLYHNSFEFWDRARSHRPPDASDSNSTSTHPITKLMLHARQEHQRLLGERQTYALNSTAARYRHLRGRHPPPGFDKWVEAALAADAVIIEEYFDRIYKDLAPFWALDASTLAKRAAAAEYVVKVRRGIVTLQGLDPARVPWMQHWSKLVAEFAKHLPDVDMPVNMMDEPRVIVPYETIDSLVHEEMHSRKLPPAAQVTANYTGLNKIDESNPQRFEPLWHGPDNAYWDLAVKACRPSTPAYGVPAIRNYTPAAEVPEDWKPGYSFHGFVHNWTAAIDPCEQPHLRQLHGSFVEPISVSSTEELVSIFSGCKLPINNDIIIPGAMYLTDDELYSGGASHGPPWRKKRNGLVWRGVDSGGRPHDNNWYHLQRHRLVEMLNGTTVARVEETGQRTLAFDLPPEDMYPPSQHRARHELGAWISKFSDVGFTSVCGDKGDGGGGSDKGGSGCEFLGPFMKPVPSMRMKHQFAYKLLADVDGNSFSARFRSFLLSTSLPLKASIYAEWHDDRLVPWLHFVPLDNTMLDLYAVLEYFGDGEEVEGRGDWAARYIADEGRKWAEKVLRRDDMRLYVWRLLLEWARVCDEKREMLGFVDDL